MGIYYAVERVDRGEAFYCARAYALAEAWDKCGGAEAPAVPFSEVVPTREALRALIHDERAADRLWAFTDEGRAAVVLLSDASTAGERIYEVRMVGSVFADDYLPDGATYVGSDVY